MGRVFNLQQDLSESSSLNDGAANLAPQDIAPGYQIDRCLPAR